MDQRKARNLIRRCIKTTQRINKRQNSSVGRGVKSALCWLTRFANQPRRLRSEV